MCKVHTGIGVAVFTKGMTVRPGILWEPCGPRMYIREARSCRVKGLRGLICHMIGRAAPRRGAIGQRDGQAEWVRVEILSVFTVTDLTAVVSASGMNWLTSFLQGKQNQSSAVCLCSLFCIIMRPSQLHGLLPERIHDMLTCLQSLGGTVLLLNKLLNNPNPN